ncbi:MAG: CPBP family intramembrane metalloprotease [Roseburia sp.]|nr:CPBP family intramembrane metalloprotease [Roseburia sp.]
MLVSVRKVCTGAARGGVGINMRKIKKLFEVPESYIQSVRQYFIQDTAMAMGLFVLYCGAMAVSGLVNKYLTTIEKTVSGIIINSCFTGVVLLLLVIKKQGVETVGLKKGNRKLSLTMGIALAAILFFCNCLSDIILEGQAFIPLKMILIYSIYYFTVGFCEEIIFRGYILTRLYGIVRNVYIDILLSGVFFVLMHFPFRMIAYGMSFFELAANVPYMADLFVTSLVLSFIRVKSDSLYGAIIPHWISDLSYSIVTHI